MNRNQIDGLIHKYYGIPYKHAGRDANGLDCLGLVSAFYKDCGIPLPDGDGEQYPPDWYKSDPERFWRGITRLGREVPLNALQPLDLVYFRMGKNITHCGVMIDPAHFLHVIEKTAVHVSPLNYSWQRRLAGARRLIQPAGEPSEN